MPPETNHPQGLIVIEDGDDSESALRGLNYRASSLTITGDHSPKPEPEGSSIPSKTSTTGHPLGPVLDLRSESPEARRKSSSRSHRRTEDSLLQSEPSAIGRSMSARQLSADDFMSDGEFEDLFTRPVRDNKQEQNVPLRSKAVVPKLPPLPLRNGRLPLDWRELASFTSGSPPQILRPKKAIELLDGDVLQITTILQDAETTEIWLRGLRYRRTKFMNGLLPKLRNEVCLILEIDQDDARPPTEQCIDEVPLSDCGALRRLLLTNQKYPKYSFVETESEGLNTPDDVVFSQCQLVCRWKYLCYFRDAAARKANQHNEKSLQCLRKNETDIALTVEDDELRTRWRGLTSKGGDVVQEERRSNVGLGREKRVTISSPSSSYVDLTPSGTRAHSPIELEPLSPIIERKGGQRRPPAPARPRLSQSITFDASVAGSGDERHVTVDDSDEDESTGAVARRGREDRQTGREQQPSFHVAQSMSASVPMGRTFEVNTLFKTRSELASVNFQYTGSITHERHPSTPKRPRPGRLSPPSSRKRLQQTETSPSYRHVQDVQTPTQKGQAQSVPKTTPRKREPIKPIVERRYTFGDVFCGAGGASRGALMAGFQVMWGVDKDGAAVQSYQQNFVGAGVWHMEINDLVAMISEDLKVDVLHISPPCQYFSPAHTVDGKDDELNTAAFFSTDALLKVTTPRIVTLENTSGLTERHGQWANAAIQMFTNHGFSVRWRLINCADLGCAQARNRMFLIASCPGEPLPEFPPATHSSDPNVQERRGLLPSTTVTDAIAYIPEGHPNHNPEEKSPRALPPYDPDMPLRACITTSGGGNYHPSGTRDLTHREFACLQGFPLEHQFMPPGVKRQIGNAVPPIVAKTIFEAIKGTLSRTDGCL